MVGLRLKVVMMSLRESCCQWSNQKGLSIVGLWVPRRLVTEIYRIQERRLHRWIWSSCWVFYCSLKMKTLFVMMKVPYHGMASKLPDLLRGKRCAGYWHHPRPKWLEMFTRADEDIPTSCKHKTMSHFRTIHICLPPIDLFCTGELLIRGNWKFVGFIYSI